jgi:ribose-phosphate pyrophosphokinase
MSQIHITPITPQLQTDADTAITSFSGGERHIQLSATLRSNIANPTCLGCNVLAQPHSASDLIDLLLTENALRHLKPELQLHLTLPYLPYARQDRVCAEGQAFSLEVLAQMLAINPKQYIVTWDVHSNVAKQLIPNLINIEAPTIIATCAPLVDLLNDENAVLICPDKGAIERCNELNKSLATALPIAYCTKIRDPSTGHISSTHVELPSNMQNLNGKTAIISDDICDGGMTFIGIAKALRALGCEHIALYVTHGIFSKGLSVFDGLIDQIFTTTSFEQIAHDKLTVIDFQTNLKELS